MNPPKFTLAFFPSCREAAQRISERHDTSLGRTVRIGLWLHLAACAHCRRYSRQLRELRRWVRKYPDQLSEVKLSANARSQIVRRLQGSG